MLATIKSLGPIRFGLYLLTLAVLPFAFIVDIDAETDWLTAVSAIVPTLAVLLFFVLLLDALMSKVFAADARQAGVTTPHRRHMYLSLAGGLLLALIWAPFFRTLL